jgi:hypothetical protein
VADVYQAILVHTDVDEGAESGHVSNHPLLDHINVQVGNLADHDPVFSVIRCYRFEKSGLFLIRK